MSTEEDHVESKRQGLSSSQPSRRAKKVSLRNWLAGQAYKQSVGRALANIKADPTQINTGHNRNIHQVWPLDQRRSKNCR